MLRKFLWPTVGVLAVLVGTAAVFVLWPMMGARAPQATPVAPSTQNPIALPPGLETFSLSPQEVRPLTPEDARRVNAEMPNSTLPIRPARRFIAPVADVESYARALDCLTAAIFYEAASEPAAGQAAVAQVILNRMHHPAYPKTVCGVVFEGSERTTGCQFTFTCDGALARPPSALGWARARAVAGAALNGGVASGVGMATHYHADFVVPYWAPRLAKIGQIGAHIFYRWPGSWGLPSAFTGRYAYPEPVQPKMAVLSSFTQPPLAADLDAAFVLPELPPLPPEPEEAASAPIRIAPRTTSAPIPLVTPPPAPSAAPETRPAPPVLADPLASQVSPPTRARRLPTPAN